MVTIIKSDYVTATEAKQRLQEFKNVSCVSLQRDKGRVQLVVTAKTPLGRTTRAIPVDAHGHISASTIRRELRNAVGGSIESFRAES